MDLKLAEVFPGQDEASLFVFVVPPPNFIHSRVQDQIQDIRVEIQELKRQNVLAQREKVWAQREKVWEQRRAQKELANLRTEIVSLQRAHQSLNLQIVLDSARRKVLDVLRVQVRHWENLRSQFADTRSLYEWLCNALGPLVDYRPSDLALRLLCQHSNLRDAGDNVAHHADKEALAGAISVYDGPDRAELVLLFEFAFGERFDTKNHIAGI